MEYEQVDILVSYVNKTEARWLVEYCPRARILMDSGAFSVKSTGVEIDLEEYIRFCQRYGTRMWAFIMLDVIRNRQRTIDNLLRMRDAGLDPMAVVTEDMDLRELPDCILESEKLCIAGGGRVPAGQFRQRVAAVRSRCPNAWLHGLSFTDRNVVGSDLQSVDSSTWIVGGRYGFMWLHVPKEARLRNVLAQRMRTRHFDRWPSWVKTTVMDRGIPADAFVQYMRGQFSIAHILTIEGCLSYYAWVLSKGIATFLVVSSHRDLKCLAVVKDVQGTGTDWWRTYLDSIQRWTDKTPEEAAIYVCSD